MVDLGNLTAEERALDQIDAALDAGLGDLIDEIVPNSGEPATADDLIGVYEVDVHEAFVYEHRPKAAPPMPRASRARARLPRSRGRQRRPGTRRSARRTSSRAGPSDLGDEPEPGNEAGRLDELTAVAS